MIAHKKPAQLSDVFVVSRSSSGSQGWSWRPRREKRMQFKSQPGLEAALIGPDGAHLRAGVAGDHRGTPSPHFVQVFILMEFNPWKYGSADSTRVAGWGFTSVEMRQLRRSKRLIFPEQQIARDKAARSFRSKSTNLPAPAGWGSNFSQDRQGFQALAAIRVRAEFMLKGQSKPL